MARRSDLDEPLFQRRCLAKPRHHFRLIVGICYAALASGLCAIGGSTIVVIATAAIEVMAALQSR
jgi:hypothetical protein